MQRTTTYLIVWMAATVMACGGDSEPADAGPAVVHAPEEGEAFFGDLRQLTFDGQNAEAYWSPDGTHLIFQRTAAGGSCDQQFTIRADGSDLTRVSNGLGATTCGYFYDGGARVLYASTFHADSACPARPDMSRGYVWGLHAFDIYASLPDGSELQRLTEEPGYDAEATLSPDGQTIVFTSTRDGDLEIYTMGVDGSDVRRLTETPGYDGGPFYSHDGSMIVYRAWHPTDPQELADYQALLADNLVRPSRMEVFVMDADGSNQRQVTNLGGANFAPFFHPDNERIIFSSNHHETDPRSRNFDLFLVNLDGTGLTQVTATPVFDGFPMFSPDGTKLAFASNRHGSVEGETNLFVGEWVEP
jgi:Tol biopolymer transport system component